MNLEEIIENITKETAAIVSANPAITSVWYEYVDVPLDQMRAVAAKRDLKVKLNERCSRMGLQFSCIIPHATAFFLSPKVRFETKIIEDVTV